MIPISALAPRQTIDGPSQCVVTAEDYRVHWPDQTPEAPDHHPEPLLCIYCAEHPVMPGSDFCSPECVINAEND